MPSKEFLPECAFGATVRDVSLEAGRRRTGPPLFRAFHLSEQLLLKNEVLVFQRPQEDRDPTEEEDQVFEDDACKGHFGGRL